MIRAVMPGPPVGIVGVGVVGTSIGLALRDAGEATMGYDSSPRHLEQSIARGAITTKCPNFSQFSCCKAIFVAVPPSEVVDVSRRLLDLTDATVVDVASVKADIANALRDPRFIPSHPLRGTHLSGPAAGRKDLFAGGIWAVCPTTWTSPKRLAVAEDLIRRMRAYPLRLDPAKHDAVMAATSHLPHLAASSLVHVLSARDQTIARRMVGGGFIDTTRIARANPSLWADITLHNRAEISESITELVDRLQAVKESIDDGDRERVLAFFADACRVMEELPQQPHSRCENQKVRRVSGLPINRNQRRGRFAGELGGVH